MSDGTAQTADPAGWAAPGRRCAQGGQFSEPSDGYPPARSGRGGIRAPLFRRADYQDSDHRGVVIEKGFQEGGRLLREQGIHLESLAVISSVEDGRITFAEE